MVEWGEAPLWGEEGLICSLLWDLLGRRVILRMGTGNQRLLSGGKGEKLNFTVSLEGGVFGVGKN